MPRFDIKMILNVQFIICFCKCHFPPDAETIVFVLWVNLTLTNLCFFFSDLVAQRGEKLELLIDKTENLVDSVRSFQNLRPSCI